MKKIRVGVIGVGYLGKFHAEKYSGMKNAQLVGVVDIDKSRAEHVAAALGTCALTDYRDLFGSVDAVSVAVPTDAHYSVGAAFLNQNVDVLIEKPMTTSLMNDSAFSHEIGIQLIEITEDIYIAEGVEVKKLTEDLEPV